MNTKTYLLMFTHKISCICANSVTYINVQAEGGDSRSLREGQEHEQHCSQQLHHVEEMIMSEQVGAERLGTPRMGEKLVVILSLLKNKHTNRHGSMFRSCCVWLSKVIVFTVYNVKLTHNSYSTASCIYCYMIMSIFVSSLFFFYKVFVLKSAFCAKNAFCKHPLQQSILWKVQCMCYINKIWFNLFFCFTVCMCTCRYIAASW